jgi:glycosyltransferase involved in cell wall biosynthesis
MYSQFNAAPLVSVIITCYNREKYISHAIESARAQTYRNTEIVISDNCSSDNSVREIDAHKSDARVKLYINSSNIGMIENFTKATKELARGKYIIYLSSDDYFVNNQFIEEAVELFEKHKNISMVVSDWTQLRQGNETGVAARNYYFCPKEKFGPNGVASGKDVFLAAAHSMGGIGFGGTVYSGAYLRDLNPLFLEGTIGWSDFRISLMLALKGDVAYIPRTTYVWRLHGSNYSSSESIKSAVQFINDSAYIQSAKVAAMKSSCFEKQVLESWLYNMEFNFFYGGLKNFYRNDLSLYQLLVNYMDENRNGLMVDICGQPKYVLYRILFSNKSVGDFIMKMYRLYLRAKLYI